MKALDAVDRLDPNLWKRLPLQFFFQKVDVCCGCQQSDNNKSFPCSYRTNNWNFCHVLTWIPKTPLNHFAIDTRLPSFACTFPIPHLQLTAVIIGFKFHA